MTIQERAERHAEKLYEADGYTTNAVVNAYLAGYNEAAKWIEVTPETIPTNENAEYLIRLVQKYSGKVQYETITGPLIADNPYWDFTHYQIITPPKQ